MLRAKDSIILGVLLLCNFTYSQNLVLNPGFEEYYYDYNEYRDYNISPITTIDSLPAKYWYDFNDGTPDFLNKHNALKESQSFQSMRMLLPDLYQENACYDGHAAMGIVVLSLGGGIEHITGVLRDTLVKDSTYIVGFDIRLANFSYICSKKIGILFTDELPFCLNKEHSLYDHLFSTPIYSNIEWDLSETCCTNKMTNLKIRYKAKGYEKYLTIGLFYQESFDLCSFFDKYRWINSKGKRYEYRLLKKYLDTPVFKVNQNYVKSTHPFSKQAYYIIDNIYIYTPH